MRAEKGGKKLYAEIGRNKRVITVYNARPSSRFRF